MSAQPNRKQQRLAREISKSEGVPYQTALTKIRATAGPQSPSPVGSVPRPTLFDQIERTNPSPAGHREDSFSFLNRVDGPYWGNVRDQLELWYEAFPDADGDLRSRFRNAAPQQHYAAWWELYLHRLFKRLGFEIEVHPVLEHSSGRPDFALTRKQEFFYVEALTVFSGIDEPGRHGAREAEITEALESVNNGDFHLKLRFIQVGSASPRRAPIVREVTGWLNSLDPNAVTNGMERTYELPTKTFTEGDWILELGAWPVTAEHRGGDHPLIVGAPISGLVNDVEKLRAALERKHARYKRPEAPLVLAVLAMSSFMEDRAIASALFGSEAIMMPKSGVGAAKMVRQPDGFWLNRGGAAGDRASAVLIGKGIMHHNCGGTWPQLWHHPLASEALNVDLPFPAARVIDDALQLTDGRGHPHELLGLTADWPGPHPPFPR